MQHKPVKRKEQENHDKPTKNIGRGDGTVSDNTLTHLDPLSTFHPPSTLCKDYHHHHRRSLITVCLCLFRFLDVDEDMRRFRPIKKGFASMAIHSGQNPEQWASKALVPPIHMSVAYKIDNMEAIVNLIHLISST